MAIYHFSGSVISRSQGRSATAASAYRSGEKLTDERTGLVHDYTHKKDIVYSEIFLPDNAPEIFKNREVLWNAVEIAEKRKDAQLAREFTVSLPRELTIKENKNLISEFVNAEFVKLGMIADVCFHNDEKPDGERQPHAHIMLTLREVTQDGFGQKVRTWNAKENLLLWREAWASAVNQHLALNGHDKQIDHRSYEAQGIGLEPQYKIGPVIAKERLARLADHQRIARENGERIFEEPVLALNALTRQQSTFTHQDLARFINRHTEGSEQFQAVYDKVTASPELVLLGLDGEGRKRLTTREMLNVERAMMQNASIINARLGHEVKQKHTDKAMLTRTLSAEQRNALRYLTDSGDLKSVVGYAGTGKSYLLGAAREAWEDSGYRVRGAALSGVAALNLTNSSGIESRTIASFLYRFDRGMDTLTSRDILVVDEAGMLGSRQMERLVLETASSGAKLVLVGDWQQLQAIEAGASFRAIAKSHQYVELNHIRRQHIAWQCEASLDLAKGRVKEALTTYREHNHLHTFDTQAEAKVRLIDQWNDTRISNPENTQIILAYTRKDVRELNEMAREQKRRDGELGKDACFDMERGERQFAVNDRVYFLKREDSLSVINGTLGTIRSMNTKTGMLKVELDRDDLKPGQRLVAVNTTHYKHLEHGYAATVYKAQGVTIDRAYLLTSRHYDSHATYVALTRHRQSCDVFVSKETFKNERHLHEVLGRNRAKDVTLDYTNPEPEFSKNRTIFTEDFLKKIITSKEKRIDFDSFKREFSGQYPELMKHVKNELLEKQITEFSKAFQQYDKAWHANQLSSDEKREFTEYTASFAKSPNRMASLKNSNPELARQVEHMLKEQEKQMGRSDIHTKGLDLTL